MLRLLSKIHSLSQISSLAPLPGVSGSLDPDLFANSGLDQVPVKSIKVLLVLSRHALGSKEK